MVRKTILPYGKLLPLALGSSEKNLANATALPGTENLVTTFRDICLNQPFYAGLAAMHAFESQVPEIAAVKIDGLARFYGMNNPDSYEFFTVHQEADIHHSQAEWALIERFADTPEKKAEVLAATTKACDALWEFLDGIYENYCADLNTKCKKAGNSALRETIHKVTKFEVPYIIEPLILLQIFF